MLLLGIDLGTSSVKASVVDASTRKIIASATWPETEAGIISKQPGWAEQDPETWWAHVQAAILHCHQKVNYNPKDIAAIGIAYQMHGLVLVDKNQQVLRHAIIWCDSRAVPFGEKAFTEMGEEKSLSGLLNSPGNFTASKLAWVKQNEPAIYSKADKLLLPGDFIALRLTGETGTTISALSEGILWDFKQDEIARDVLQYFGFEPTLIPSVQPVFSQHGTLLPAVAE